MTILQTQPVLVADIKKLPEIMSFQNATQTYGTKIAHWMGFSIFLRMDLRLRLKGFEETFKTQDIANKLANCTA